MISASRFSPAMLYYMAILVLFSNQSDHFQCQCFSFCNSLKNFALTGGDASKNNMKLEKFIGMQSLESHGCGKVTSSTHLHLSNDSGSDSVEDNSDSIDNVKDTDETIDVKIKELKYKILELGASYDRGFGASPSAREEMSLLLTDLKQFNPTVELDIPNDKDSFSSSPLKGIYRMIWCTAQDVLVLNASPLSTVSAIYQVFDLPTVTNIIDFIPRLQSLLPPQITPSSIVRAEVTTKASPRSQKPLRVGLDFEAVAIKPVEVFGQLVKDSLPPFGFDLPRVPSSLNNSESPGYFDVLFLDSSMLVIEQNVGGGIFVLVQVDSIKP